MPVTWRWSGIDYFRHIYRKTIENIQWKYLRPLCSNKLASSREISLKKKKACVFFCSQRTVIFASSFTGCRWNILSGVFFHYLKHSPRLWVRCRRKKVHGRLLGRSNMFFLTYAKTCFRNDISALCTATTLCESCWATWEQLGGTECLCLGSFKTGRQLWKHLEVCVVICRAVLRS